MSREHKFKAWDEQSKTMHIPMTLQQIKHVLVAGSAGETGTAGSVFCITFNDLIFLEFTGLKDKNGKEIYEGDIVKIEECECTGHNYEDDSEIWEPCEGAILFEDGMFVFEGHSAGTLPLSAYKNDIEVIGNIYQTK